MSDIHCKSCGSLEFVRNGFVRGPQRYRCKHCSYNFTNTDRRGVHPALKAFGIVLYGMCGVSMNKIAKLFGVSDVAVLKWVRKEAKLLSDPVALPESDIVMIDEMWHFVNGKKTKFGSGEPLTAYRVALSDGSWALVATHAARN